MSFTPDQFLLTCTAMAYAMRADAALEHEPDPGRRAALYAEAARLWGQADEDLQTCWECLPNSFHVAREMLGRMHGFIKTRAEGTRDKADGILRALAAGNGGR
ncbi:MAG: hypothetical protein LBW85_01420 [Deltaproteobacteria bacterium]|jgi:hypothetical protein|nr:hypothetical protein [Deltaproteobacteria bacterium]